MGSGIQNPAVKCSTIVGSEQQYIVYIDIATWIQSGEESMRKESDTMMGPEQ